MTRARQRMPAYGRALFDARVAGRHPAGAWVIVGDDWGRRPADLPSVCVGADWAPGCTDWRMLAGLPVRVVCRWPFLESPDGVDTEEHPLGWLPLLAMLGEIATVAAPVTLYWVDPDWPGSWWQRCGADAGDLARSAAMCWGEAVLAAFAGGAWDDYQRRKLREWPSPWSWRLLDDYTRRAEVWLLAPFDHAARAA